MANDQVGLIHLKTGKLLDIHDGQGLRVKVLDGVAWVTQSNDPRDIVIEAGQSFVLDRPGLTLVNPLLVDATIAITMARHPKRQNISEATLARQASQVRV
jgi:hypothetical protein